MGRRILSDAGYEVITVNNGAAALKKVSELAPDVIVLDVYMPGYGGLEVCQRLKEMSETARIPILLSVGKLEPFKPEEARRVRADAFIVKPFEATELLAALTKLEDRIVPSSDGPKSKKSSGDAARGEGHGDQDTGWKNRLIIPPGGKGRTPDAAEADDFGQTEDSAKKSKKDEKPAAVAKTEENVKAASEEKVVSIDVKASEAKSGETKSGETKVAEAKSDAVKAEFEVKAEAAQESAAESKAAEPAKEVAKAESESKSKVESKTQDAQPAEVKVEAAAAISETVAAKTETAPAANATASTPTYSGPRWIAEEVSASTDEKSLALDREMEKSFAAAAAFDAGQKIAAEIKEEVKAEAVVEAAKEVTASEPVPAVAETKVEEIKAEESKAVEAKVEEVKVEVAKAEETANPESKPEESATPVETPIVVPPVEAVAEQTQPQEVASSVVVNTEAVSDEAANSEAVAQPKGEAFAAAASAGSSSTESVVAEVPAPIAPSEDHANKQQLAAAWEQWQNVRESVLNSPVAEKITEVAAATLRHAAESAASAASTKADIEVSQSAPASNPTNIANIVDSVLAELKPKLVEEIAKKLGNDKK